MRLENESRMRVGSLQICSKLDPAENLEKLRSFIPKIKEEKLDAVFLPEVFYSMSDGTGNTPYLVEDQNEHYQAIVDLVKDFGTYVLGGTVATKVGDKVINRNFNFKPNGEALPHYDKINLFSCDVTRPSGERIVLKESDLYYPGNEPLMLDIMEFKMGLSVCFDLRFSKMYDDYKKQGANLFSISSAFTKTTGEAHWHTLVRARAIETQSYVIATNQWGPHGGKMHSFGHSLIIDPWGDILGDAGEGESLICADLSLDKVSEARSKVIM